MSLGLSNPNGETFVDYKIDPVGANNAFGAGITSGFSVVPKTGMTVSVGGETGVQDSAIVKAISGVIYPVGNLTGESLDVEIDGAPSTNSRIDAIVLSVDTTSTTSEINGEDLISVAVVKGTSSASPTAPSDADITSEIGAGKAFIVLGYVNIPAGTTDITADMIEQGTMAKIGIENQGKVFVQLRSQNAVSVNGNNTNVMLPYINIDAENGNWREYFQLNSNGTLTALKDFTFKCRTQAYATNTTGNNGRVNISIYNNTQEQHYINSYNQQGHAFNYCMYATGVAYYNITAGDNIQTVLSSSSQTLQIAPNPGQTYTWFEVV